MKPITEIVLACIQAHPNLTIPQVASRAGLKKLQARNALNRLMKSKRAHCLLIKRTGYWFAGPSEKPTEPGVAMPDRISKMTGQYTCPELRTSPYRAGAMDAYKLPSRGL